jgi:hypothetical protein
MLFGHRSRMLSTALDDITDSYFGSTHHEYADDGDYDSDNDNDDNDGNLSMIVEHSSSLSTLGLQHNYKTDTITTNETNKLKNQLLAVTNCDGTASTLTKQQEHKKMILIDNQSQRINEKKKKSKCNETLHKKQMTQSFIFPRKILGVNSDHDHDHDHNNTYNENSDDEMLLYPTYPRLPETYNNSKNEPSSSCTPQKHRNFRDIHIQNHHHHQYNKSSLVAIANNRQQQCHQNQHMQNRPQLRRFLSCRTDTFKPTKSSILSSSSIAPPLSTYSLHLQQSALPLHNNINKNYASTCQNQPVVLKHTTTAAAIDSAMEKNDQHTRSSHSLTSKKKRINTIGTLKKIDQGDQSSIITTPTIVHGRKGQQSPRLLQLTHQTSIPRLMGAYLTGLQKTSQIRNTNTDKNIGLSRTVHGYSYHPMTSSVRSQNKFLPRIVRRTDSDDLLSSSSFASSSKDNLSNSDCSDAFGCDNNSNHYVMKVRKDLEKQHHPHQHQSILSRRRYKHTTNSSTNSNDNTRAFATSASATSKSNNYSPIGTSNRKALTMTNSLPTMTTIKPFPTKTTMSTIASCDDDVYQSYKNIIIEIDGDDEAASIGW